MEGGATVPPSPRLRQAGASAVKADSTLPPSQVNPNQAIDVRSRKDFHREHWYSPGRVMETSYERSNQGMPEVLREAKPTPRFQDRSAVLPDMTNTPRSVASLYADTRGNKLNVVMQTVAGTPRKASTYQDAYPVVNPFQHEQLGPETIYNARKSELGELAKLHAQCGNMMRSRVPAKQL